MRNWRLVQGGPCLRPMSAGLGSAPCDPAVGRSVTLDWTVCPAPAVGSSGEVLQMDDGVGGRSWGPALSVSPASHCPSTQLCGTLQLRNAADCGWNKGATLGGSTCSDRC